MKKFEYHVIPIVPGFLKGFDTEDITKHLNQLGQQGWEVVTVAHTGPAGGQGLLYTFKRELAG